MRGKAKHEPARHKKAWKTQGLLDRRSPNLLSGVGWPLTVLTRASDAVIPHPLRNASAQNEDGVFADFADSRQNRLS